VRQRTKSDTAPVLRMLPPRLGAMRKDALLIANPSTLVWDECPLNDRPWRAISCKADDSL